jgi:RNA polymerase sigma-70 factor (ECF subfamily)
VFSLRVSPHAAIPGAGPSALLAVAEQPLSGGAGDRRAKGAAAPRASGELTAAGIEPLEPSEPVPGTATMEYLATLYDEQAPRLFRLARRLGHDGEAARDLVQEVFVRAAAAPSHLPAVPPQAAAWLVRVLVNAAHDRHRRNRLRRTEPLDVELPSQGDAAADVVARATVRRALAHLPLRRRTIVVLAELEGASVADIAAALGITRVTVRWHLAIGRRELRQWLVPAPTAGRPRERRP